ncbi:MAG: hypothetical protein ACOY90_15695 [Candidatus Zhuqueibacterota bacterium]
MAFPAIKVGARRIDPIACDVEFNNPSYFAECFRQQFGVLPSEYIAREN